MGKIPVGLQLYTLREDMKDDFTGVLKKVADMGYKAVEFAGYGNLEARELRKVLDDLGLEGVSSHVGLHLLENELQKQIEYSLEIGARYIVCPWLDAKKFHNPADFQALMNLFRRVGESCNRQGLTFAYHNHAFEFEKIDGKYILDLLYKEVDSALLKAELDLYWVKKGGLDPAEYLQSYKGRCPIVHVKDMAGDEKGSFAEVGSGIIDYPAIFAIAEEVGVQYYIVEQDQCLNHPPLESVKISIDYLKSIGIA
jgi:sugar phosphate isomerase/epimerase